MSLVEMLALAANPWYETTGTLIHHLPDWVVFAQQIEDPDVLGQIQDAWNTFITSGQVWALIIGLIVGYVFRGMTSF